MKKGFFLFGLATLGAFAHADFTLAPTDYLLKGFGSVNATQAIWLDFSVTTSVGWRIDAGSCTPGSSETWYRYGSTQVSGSHSFGPGKQYVYVNVYNVVSPPVAVPTCPAAGTCAQLVVPYNATLWEYQEVGTAPGNGGGD